VQESKGLLGLNFVELEVAMVVEMLESAADPVAAAAAAARSCAAAGIAATGAWLLP